jgi:hypothetical protein
MLKHVKITDGPTSLLCSSSSSNFYMHEYDILFVPSLAYRKVWNLYWRMRFHHKDMEFFIFSEKICFNS